MADNILEFYRGETANWIEGPIKFDGVLQDIRADSVRLVIKRKKSDLDTAIVIGQPTGVSLDVATDGENGNAHGTLTNEQTDIPHGSYEAEVIWEPDGGGEYLVPPFERIVLCKERVEDVP